MADRSRDLKFAVLSDVDKLETDRAARGLEDLGDAADKAGRKVDDLGDEANKAGRKVDNLEDDSKAATSGLEQLEKSAQDTARNVSDAFDRIAASSRDNMRQVDDSADRAGEGLNEFKDEAAGTSREVAASFGSVEDALGGIQEIAANALAGFGPAGAAAGIAAAIGIGFVTSEVQKAKERVAELTQSFFDLRKEGIDPAADSASHLVDELDAADLAKFKRDADELGLSYDTLREAFDGNAEAIAIARAAIQKYNDENARGNPMTGQQADLHTRLTTKLNETEEASRNAAEAVKVLGDSQTREAESTEAATKALDDHAAALDAFVDPVAVYTELLAAKEEKERATANATAAATKDQADSWEDYVKSADVSVDEYLDALDKQVQAQEQWAGNLQALAARGIDEGVLAQLERLGPEGAPLVAKLTQASDKELNRMVELYGRQGAAAGQSVAEGIVAQTGQVREAAAALHSGAARILGGQLTIPIGFERRYSMTDLQRLKYDIQNQIGTIVIPVKPGQNPYENNANNSRNRW